MSFSMPFSLYLAEHPLIPKSKIPKSEIPKSEIPKSEDTIALLPSFLMAEIDNPGQVAREWTGHFYTNFRTFLQHRYPVKEIENYLKKHVGTEKENIIKLSTIQYPEKNQSTILHWLTDNKDIAWVLEVFNLLLPLYFPDHKPIEATIHPLNINDIEGKTVLDALIKNHVNPSLIGANKEKLTNLIKLMTQLGGTYSVASQNRLNNNNYKLPGGSTVNTHYYHLHPLPQNSGTGVSRPPALNPNAPDFTPCIA
ncbi:MAG: hypothetical protein AAGI66_06895 [Cyanobacteria bacterium P01_H01_bin.74]